MGRGRKKELVRRGRRRVNSVEKFILIFLFIFFLWGGRFRGRGVRVVCSLGVFWCCRLLVVRLRAEQKACSCVYSAFIKIEQRAT